MSESRDGAYRIPRSNVTFLRGHWQKVKACTFIPGSERIASVSSDGTTRLWDMDEDNIPASVEGGLRLMSHLGLMFSRSITCLDVNHQGSRLAVGTDGGRVTIWKSPANGANLRNVTVQQHMGPINAIKWSRNGRLVASAGGDGIVVVYNVVSKMCATKFPRDGTPIIDIDWGANNIFAFCTEGMAIEVWDLVNGQPLKYFTGHSNRVNAVKWDPQGTLFASCSDDSSVRIWGLEEDSCVHNLLGHAKKVTTISWAPNGPGTRNPCCGPLLASGGTDCTVRLWDVQRGSCLTTLWAHTASVNSVSFSPNGWLLASGSNDGRIFIWSVQSRQVVYWYKCPDRVLNVCWDSWGDKVCAGLDNSRICVLHLRNLF